MKVNDAFDVDIIGGEDEFKERALIYFQEVCIA
jgi:hypothetical protein